MSNSDLKSTSNFDPQSILDWLKAIEQDSKAKKVKKIFFILGFVLVIKKGKTQCFT
jgi:hypothetical protein